MKELPRDILHGIGGTSFNALKWRDNMKYFIDTHDKAKGSLPVQVLTVEQQFGSLEKAGEEFRVIGHAAHVNLEEGKAFCFMSGPDEECIRKTHEAINLPYDSITEVKRVTGADWRVSPITAKKQ